MPLHFTPKGIKAKDIHDDAAAPCGEDELFSLFLTVRNETDVIAKAAAVKPARIEALTKIGGGEFDDPDEAQQAWREAWSTVDEFLEAVAAVKVAVGKKKAASLFDLEAADVTAALGWLEGAVKKAKAAGAKKVLFEYIE